jgi:hypothetical protein
MVRAYVGILLALATASCAGGQFRIDPALQAVPPVVISGDRAEGATCTEGDNATGLQKLTAGKQATLAGMTTRIMGVHGTSPMRSAEIAPTLAREVSTELEAVGDLRRASLVRALATVDPKGTGEVVATVDSAVSTARDVDELVSAVRRLSSLTRTTTETYAFTFMSRRGDAHVLSICETKESIRALGLFDRPRFEMTCFLASDRDAQTRTLTIRAGGTWANPTYGGELTTVGGGTDERAALASQNISILGAGIVRGFDLRSGGAQIAAVSFFEGGIEQATNRYPTHAWRLGRGSDAWRDIVDHTLAMTFLFPWPGSCDADTRRNQMVSGDSARSTGRQ